MWQDHPQTHARCLWQISGRNDIADFEEWVRLDLA